MGSKLGLAGAEAGAGVSVGGMSDYLTRSGHNRYGKAGVARRRVRVRT